MKVETKTDYPFGETLEMSVNPVEPLVFPLELRVPEWCRTPEIGVNGVAVNLCARTDGFVVVNREWKAGDVVRLRFPMTPKSGADA